MKMEKVKKYRLTALTRVGRGRGLMKKGEIFKGALGGIYNRLDKCFINGCEIEQERNTTKYKVHAGWGSHVADIKIEEVD